MAVVILGGLVTSTVLNLFLMPSLYLAFGHSRRRFDEEAGRWEESALREGTRTTPANRSGTGPALSAPRL